MNQTRIHDIYRDAVERVHDFNEVERRLDGGEIHDQAARCMNCGIPFCHGAGCPLENRIPDINNAVAEGEWRKAWEILRSTSSFPEFTSRVCPALCEGSCVNGIENNSVMIRQLEKAVVDAAYVNSYPILKTPAPATGKHVAVIGGGPGGLAAAQTLALAGHEVTVFERNHRPGGLLRYGIPDFKLDKGVIERRVRLMEEHLNIHFECDTEVGKDIAAAYILKKFDAVVLSIGTPAPRDLPIPGRELQGIHFALEFLQGQNRVVASELKDLPVCAAGKHVVIVGGGDTGSDCLGTSIRQHAASVTQLEIMPQPPENRSASTPWPDWPWLLRTSSSHKEGGTRLWNVQTLNFVGNGERVTGLEIGDVEWEFSALGRPLKFAPKANTTRTIPADLVLLAMGFVGVPKSGLAEACGLVPDARGKVASAPERGIFVVGDSANGASLVVRAIAHGKAVAQDVSKYLASH